MSKPTVEPWRGKVWAGAWLMLAATVGFLVSRYVDVFWNATASVAQIAQSNTSNPHSFSLAQLLGALGTIVLVARIFGSAATYLGQPRVIGEIVAGLVLGPSVLGKIFPGTMAFLFPTSVFPALEVLAHLGVILFMFLVGLHFDSGELRTQARTTAGVSVASVAVPFVVGIGLGVFLFERYSGASVSLLNFTLFIGLAMSITAFPVLARILTDRRMEDTELGQVALTCAAAGDLIAWCLLAFVVGLAQADTMGATRTIALSVVYITVMFAIVRPVLYRTFQGTQRIDARSNAYALVIIGLLISALLTDVIGIHALFGAFLLGAIIPHDSSLARSLRFKLEDIVTILLLPTFFALTGLRTQLGLLSQPSDWAVCALVILLAGASKFAGTFAAARVTGLEWRNAASLGVLMNTRGLMELIVLNIGLELGILSSSMFAILVLMAVVSTIATNPFLDLLLGRPKDVTGLGPSIAHVDNAAV